MSNDDYVHYSDCCRLSRGLSSQCDYVCRMLALPDPREGGSGNPGATNVLRLGGKKAAALTLAGDVAKGLVPVLVANLMELDPWVTGACAIAAFAGHLYPIFFGFKGGKGYATALGVIAGLSTTTFVAVGLTWLAVAGIWRYSSLAALTSIALTPVYAWFLTGHVEWTIATSLSPCSFSSGTKATSSGLWVVPNRKLVRRPKTSSEAQNHQSLDWLQLIQRPPRFRGECTGRLRVGHSAIARVRDHGTVVRASSSADNKRGRH